MIIPSVTNKIFSWLTTNKYDRVSFSLSLSPPLARSLALLNLFSDTLNYFSQNVGRKKIIILSKRTKPRSLSVHMYV